MSNLLHQPPWICGLVIVGSFVVIAVGGLPGRLQRITAWRLHLTEAMLVVFVVASWTNRRAARSRSISTGPVVFDRHQTELTPRVRLRENQGFASV